MEKIFLSISFLSCFFSSFSQANFLTIKPVKSKYVTIKGNYTPSEVFLKINPSYLENGKYVFDIKDYQIDSYDNDYTIHASTEENDYYLEPKFDSEKYPVTITNSSKKVNPNFFYQIRLGSEKIFHLDGSARVMIHPIELNSNEFVRDEERPFGWASTNSKESKNGYEKFNNYFKETIRMISDAKIITHSQVDDILTYQAIKLDVNKPVLILEFIYKDGKTFIKSNGAPSYIKYNLRVKDIFGSTLKEYGQAFFYEGKTTRLSDEKGRGFVFRETLYDGITSLLNQYLEDSSFQSSLFKMTESADANLLLTNNYSKIEELSFKRDKFNELLVKITDRLNYYGETLDNPNYDLKSASQVSSDQKINATVFAAASIFNFFGAKRDQKMAKGLKELGEKIIDSIQEYSKEILALEKQIPDSLLNIVKGDKRIMDSSSDLFKSFNSVAQNAINTTNGAKKSVSSMLQSSLSEFSSTFNDKAGASSANALTSQLNALNSPVNKSVPSITPETYAINKDAKLDQNVDPCMQKAYAEYYKSTEYKNWMNNKGIAAHSYEVQAKLVEVTLKYCKEQLPPDEYKMLVKLAADTRAVARDLRKTKGSGFVIGQ